LLRRGRRRRGRNGMNGWRRGQQRGRGNGGRLGGGHVRRSHRWRCVWGGGWVGRLGRQIVIKRIIIQLYFHIASSLEKAHEGFGIPIQMFIEIISVYLCDIQFLLWGQRHVTIPFFTRLILNRIQDISQSRVAGIFGRLGQISVLHNHHTIGM